jgi:hypothetical protein
MPNIYMSVAWAMHGLPTLARFLANLSVLIYIMGLKNIWRANTLPAPSPPFGFLNKKKYKSKFVF